MAYVIKTWQTLEDKSVIIKKDRKVNMKCVLYILYKAYYLKYLANRWYSVAFGLK